MVAKMQIVDRIFNILEFVAEDPDNPRSLSEIATQSRLNPSTCANITKGLVERGYLEQIAPKKGYILGPMPYYLARNGQYRKDLVSLAHPFMSELADCLQEAVQIAVMRDTNIFILHQIQGNQALQVRSDLLMHHNIYQTAMGRLLLAFSSEKQIEKYILEHGLPGNAWPEAGTAEELHAALQEIKSSGCSYIVKDSQVAGVACPIRENDRVIAALGVCLPAFRFKGEHKGLIMEKLHDAAVAVSRQF
jgi:DNA-binding IclR family transcriptional regulator